MARRTLKYLILSLVGVIILSGCDQAALRDQFAPNRAEKFAKDYLALFRTRDFQAIEARIDPAVKGPTLMANLEKVAALFPTEAPKDVVLLGERVVNDDGARAITLSLQYEFADRWVLANVALHEAAEGFLVDGAYVHQRSEPIENLNRFTFADKDLRHYVLFIAAIIVPLLSLVALVRCLRMPILQQKWLWALAIVLSVAPVTLNWTTGELSFDAFNVVFFGASAWKASAYSPVMLSAAVPLGAILFLLMHTRPHRRGVSGWMTKAGSNGRKRVSKGRVKGRALHAA